MIGEIAYAVRYTERPVFALQVRRNGIAQRRYSLFDAGDLFIHFGIAIVYEASVSAVDVASLMD